MKIINERSQVRDVARAWKEQYKGWNGPNRKENDAIGRALSALNKETATAADVEEIIGNGSWVKQKPCNECGNLFETVIEIGEPDDYESRTVTLCVGCVEKALKAMRAAVTVPPASASGAQK